MNQCPGKLVSLANPRDLRILRASSTSDFEAAKPEASMSTVNASVECLRVLRSATNCLIPESGAVKNLIRA